MTAREVYDDVMRVVNGKVHLLTKEQYQLLCEDLTAEFEARHEAVSEEIAEEARQEKRK